METTLAAGIETGLGIEDLMLALSSGLTLVGIDHLVLAWKPDLTLA